MLTKEQACGVTELTENNIKINELVTTSEVVRKRFKGLGLWLPFSEMALGAPFSDFSVPTVSFSLDGV